MTLLTPHFGLSELGCHSGEPYPAEWVESRAKPLCEMLETIRTAWGGPLLILSGYRSPAWNAHVGGARASQHMEGRAADICPVHVAGQIQSVRVAGLWKTIMDLYDAGQLSALTGCGIYPLWAHVDIRPRPPSGHLAQWTGTGVGSEVTG